MEKLIIPDLYCPFPLQINKHVDVLEDYALEWVTRFNLLKDELSYQRFRKAKFYWLAASAYPNCQLEELKIANDWLSLLFIWDDQCDMSGLGKQPLKLKVLCNRFLEILNGGELNINDIPLMYAVSNLRERMLQRTSLQCFYNFVTTFEDYFEGCCQEACNRVEGIIPDIQSYIRIRTLTSAIDICFGLTEFCNHFIIPDFLRNHEFMKQIKQKAVNIICWSNDIFSFDREITSGHFHNLVAVFQYHQKFNLALAISRASEMHDLEVNELIFFQKNSPCFGERLDDVIEQYITGINAWISGNLNWYLFSERYQNIEVLEAIT